MAAGLRDLITQARALQAIEQPDLPDAAELAQLELIITGLSAAFDDRIGPTVQRTMTSEVRGHGCELILPVRPVVSITSVTEWEGGTLTVLSAENRADPSLNDYRVDLAAGILERRSWGRPSTWQHDVIVVYEAGRCANTATVPASIQLACSIAVRHLWEQQHLLGPVSIDNGPMPRTFAIPRRALDVIPHDEAHFALG